MVILFRQVGSEFYKRADGSGGGIKRGHLMILDHFPEATRVRISRNAFEYDLGRPDGERTISHISVPRDPAYVGRAPEDIGRLVVENPLHARDGAQQKARGRVLHAFWLAGGTGGVERK